MAKQKYYYITLCRQYNSNTSTYVLLGSYDSLTTFRSALKAFTNALMAGNTQIVAITPYKRDDGCESWYITVK